MYLIPGYIEIDDNGKEIILSSRLLQNKIRLFDEHFLSKMRRIMINGGTEHLSSEVEMSLHEHGILQTEDEIRTSIKKVRKLLDSNLFLTIMPTEQCNFRCVYCYEEHKTSKMDPEIVGHIKEYIRRESDYVGAVNISWFGGEPTLCHDIIEDLSEWIIDLQKTKPFLYQATMTTNGYLLNVERFMHYYDLGIKRYQITLDGNMHDKMRPHISGAPTLNRIINNLKEISHLPQEYDFLIDLRYNSASQEVDETWFNYIKSVFGEDPRFEVAFAIVKDWGGESVKNIDLLDDRDQAVREAEKYFDKIGLKYKKRSLDAFHNVCYASCFKGLIFRPNGSIEKCSISIGNVRNKVGIVDKEKGVIIDDEKNAMWCTNDIPDICLTCKEVLSCLNICCKKDYVINHEARRAPFCIRKMKKEQK